MQITVDGLSIRYQDRGEGRPLLFLHGWGTEAATYHLILDHLSARFRIIAPDLPGFGGSEQPPAPWGIEEYAAFVRHFLEVVGVRPEVVMGHSNGGRILLYLLSETPPALPAGQAVLIDSAGIRPKHGFGWYVRVYSYKAAKRFVTLAPVRRLWPELEARAKAHFGSADYQRADERMRQTLVRNSRCGAGRAEGRSLRICRAMAAVPRRARFVPPRLTHFLWIEVLLCCFPAAC